MGVERSERLQLNNCNSPAIEALAVMHFVNFNVKIKTQCNEFTLITICDMFVKIIRN